jgi:hypothetical protein
MLNKVVSVRHAGDFRLSVTFADGASGTFDVGPALGKAGAMGQVTLAPDCFPRVFLEFGALTWPSGYDICPDWLRIEMAKAGVLSAPVAA